jgi:hypothetical protein
MKRFRGILALPLFPLMCALDILLVFLFKRKIAPVQSWRETWATWKLAYWY